MTVLTWAQRKEVEGKIRDYWTMRRNIAEWRDGIVHGRTKRDAPGRGKAHQDPTANTALRLSTPPKHIRECQVWVDAIDAVKRQSEGSDCARVFEEWYWVPKPSPVNVAMRMNTDDGARTLRRWREKVTLAVYIAAIKKGVRF